MFARIKRTKQWYDGLTLQQRLNWRKVFYVGGFLVTCAVAYASLDFLLSPARYTQDGGVTRTYAVIDTEDGTYTGPLKNGVYDGTGAYAYKIGSEDGKGKPARGIYVGAFERSKRNGTGQLYLVGSTAFAGEWKDDKMVDGTYTFEGRKRFEGRFDEDGLLDSGYLWVFADEDPEHPGEPAVLLGKIVEKDVEKLWVFDPSGTQKKMYEEKPYYTISNLFKGNKNTKKAFTFPKQSFRPTLALPQD